MKLLCYCVRLLKSKECKCEVKWGCLLDVICHTYEEMLGTCVCLCQNVECNLERCHVFGLRCGHHTLHRIHFVILLVSNPIVAYKPWCRLCSVQLTLLCRLLLTSPFLIVDESHCCNHLLDFQRWSFACFYHQQPGFA